MSDQSSIALAMAMYPSPVDPAVLDETFFSHEVDYLPLFADDSTPFGSTAALDAGYGDPQTLFEPMEIDQLFAPQVEAPEDTSANVSSTFHPDFTHQGQIADIVFVSSDLVHFYVVSQVLQEKSTNMFGHHLPAVDNVAVMMPMAASALNVLLHAVYSISPEKYAPTAADIGQAVAAMNTYGLSPTELITPSSSLFQVIARSALSAPFECYSIAASAELEELAVTVSQYTLSKKLWELTDDVGEQIGPQYLKRLFFLHLGRIEALKRLVFPPPGPHPPTDDCSLPEQRKLARAWTLAIGYMTWESRPDLPLSSIEGVLRPLDQQLTCPVCREYLDQRIRKLMVEWSLVKRTI